MTATGIQATGIHSISAGAVPQDMVRVACVQFAARRGESVDGFARRVADIVAMAARTDARLVAFPAYTGLAYLTAACPGAPLFFGPGLAAAVSRAFASSGANPRAAFLGIFSELARRHRLYIAPGTVLVPSAGGVSNLAHLISPTGEVIGAQAQTHLCRDERASGFVRADDLKAFHTSLGRIGFAACEDAWYPEVMRILALQGAAIIIAPTAVPRPYGKWHQVRGMWQNVQQNQVFGIEACLVGVLGGVDFEGRSAILGPCEITDRDTGMLAHARRTDSEELLVADVSFAAARTATERFGIFDQFNVPLYRRWLPGLYREHVSTRGGPAREEDIP